MAVRNQKSTPLLVLALLILSASLDGCGSDPSTSGSSTSDTSTSSKGRHNGPSNVLGRWTLASVYQVRVNPNSSQVQLFPFSKSIFGDFSIFFHSDETVTLQPEAGRFSRNQLSVDGSPVESLGYTRSGYDLSFGTHRTEADGNERENSFSSFLLGQDQDVRLAGRDAASGDFEYRLTQLEYQRTERLELRFCEIRRCNQKESFVLQFERQQSEPMTAIEQLTDIENYFDSAKRRPGHGLPEIPADILFLHREVAQYIQPFATAEKATARLNPQGSEEKSKVSKIPHPKMENAMRFVKRSLGIEGIATAVQID